MLDAHKMWLSSPERFSIFIVVVVVGIDDAFATNGG